MVRPEIAECWRSMSRTHRYAELSEARRSYSESLEKTSLVRGLNMVRPEGFEPPTFWFVAKHSIQLSYGRKLYLVVSPFISRIECFTFVMFDLRQTAS